MKTLILLACMAALNCSNNKIKPDAYGNFEATEITVSAGNSGEILRLEVEEGDQLEKGEVVGLIDTTQLHLQKEALKVKVEILKAKIPNILSEIEVLKEKKKNLLNEINRYSRLAEAGAVPQKKVDDLNNQLEVLKKQIDAVQSKKLPIYSELELIHVNLNQLNEQINDAVIAAPVSGTVLLKIAEEGEMVNRGAPLFRMAQLDHLILRAYVGALQLDNISLGEKVKVLIDKNEEEYHEYKGKIIWISDKAEFTPTLIQTKEERTDLVYAVKIKVPNDGTLKIGMPGVVIFNDDKSKEK